jgi:hypothetical protein
MMSFLSWFYLIPFGFNPFFIVVLTQWFRSISMVPKSWFFAVGRGMMISYVM